MNWDISENNRLLILRSATELELEQLELTFTKKIENARFDPRVKKGWWDGTISYFKASQYLPAGLWNELVDMCREFNFELNINGIERLFDREFDEEDFREWVIENWKDNDKESRDYQIDSAIRLIKYRSCLAELATSAGKTLIIFKVVSYLLSKKKAKRILMIVPTVDLVIQSAADFAEYNQESVKMPLRIQQIYAGMKLKEDTNVVIGTYQSLVKKTTEYFSQFDMVIVDETHKAKSVSIKTILEKCENSTRRIGLSGTIPKRGSLDRLTIMAYTGPVITTIKADFLIDQGYISPVEVYSIRMNYAPNDIKMSFRELFYSEPEDRKRLLGLEQNYVIANAQRLEFVCNFIMKNPKNILVLFYRIEYGTKIFNKLRDMSIGTGKKVYYIDGGTDKDLREKYKEMMEDGEGKIMVASYGTFSTGINIKNLHGVYLTESFKSEVIIRQSIGRGLRKHANKTMLLVFDFVDDFSVGKFTNYIVKHYERRKEIYEQERFPLKEKFVDLTNKIV